MRALLDQEVDMEELFEYDENDEEDDEFSEKGKQELVFSIYKQYMRNS